MCGYLFGNNNPEYSDKIIYSENKAIGFITSSVFSLQRNEWLALGYRDTKANVNSSSVSSFLQNGERIEVQISSLPFNF